MADQFPVERAFATHAEVWAYLRERPDAIRCLRCGGWFRSLGSHLRAKHGWSSDDYKGHYGLPYSSGKGLACAEHHEAKSAHMKTQMAGNTTRIDHLKMVRTTADRHHQRIPPYVREYCRDRCARGINGTRAAGP